METTAAEQLAATGIGGLTTSCAVAFRATVMFLIGGTPGTGKTTLAMQFLLEGIRRGETCLYVTLVGDASGDREGRA